VKITYRGSSTTGVVIAATGDLVEHGGTVDVPAEVGVGLLVQDGWEPADAEPENAAAQLARIPDEIHTTVELKREPRRPRATPTEEV
jgi:hypothetical protein